MRDEGAKKRGFQKARRRVLEVLHVILQTYILHFHFSYFAVSEFPYVRATVDDLQKVSGRLGHLLMIAGCAI